MEVSGEYRGGGSTGTLIVFIIIAVAGLGSAFGFYSQWDKGRAIMDEQEQQIEGLQGQVKALGDGLDEWITTSGWDNNLAMAEALKPVPDLAPVNTKRALEVLGEQARQAEQRASGMEAQFMKASNDLASLEKQLEDTVTAKDAEIKTLEDEKAEMESGYKSELKKRDDLVNQLRTEKRAAEDASTEAQDTLEEKTADFKRLMLEKDASIADMRKKLRIIEEKAEDPDGFIVKFDDETDYGTINLGAIDHVKVGMIFQVYQLGRGGEILPKGRVQVRRVNEKASVVGVIETVPDWPIIEGDYVMTLMLAKEKPVFVIAGWFPPELQYTPREICFLAESWGGVVAEEVTLDTNYLVVGSTRADADATPEAQAAAQKGLESYNLARELGITILDVDKFLEHVRR